MAAPSHALVTFGVPTDFAIEAYHEPSGPDWVGFGRIALKIQGVSLGDIRESHCSLFHAADQLRVLPPIITTLWDPSFSGLSDSAIFAFLDDALYIGTRPQWERYGRFDFLTNTGEQFDGFKAFIICRPDNCVHILYQLRDDTFGSASCSIQSFHQVSESFVLWFDEQIRTTAPPDVPTLPMPDHPTPEITLLRAAYTAFNARDIDAALALMTPDVAWPKAFKGGFVRGPEEVRAYWTEQWSEIDPRVEPVSFHAEEAGRIWVEVHQLVRDLAGTVLADEHAGHRFTFAHGLIKAMEVAPRPSSI